MNPYMRDLPDLAQSMGRLKTMIDLNEKVNTETSFGFAVKLAFIKNEPSAEIVAMIKDQLFEHRQEVEKSIPKEIINSIEKYWPENDPDDLKNVL